MKKEATLINHATQSYEICLYTQYWGTSISKASLIIKNYSNKFQVVLSTYYFVLIKKTFVADKSIVHVKLSYD
jgi:hypothetical protein